MTPPADPGPNLLLDWRVPQTSNRILRAGLGSAIAHVVIVSALVILINLEPDRRDTPPEIARVHKTVTPLIAPPPPTQITQKEPNRHKVAKEVRLENLLPEPQVAQRVPVPPAPAQKMFKAPPSNPAPPSPKPSPVMQPAQEPPKIEASVRPPQALPSSVIAPPPPQIEAVEKPKLAFETPGQSGTAPQRGGSLKIPIPKATVEEAVHVIARSGGGQGRVMVGDSDEIPSLGDVLRQAPSRGKVSSSMELISDPMGVDFKPYLIRVLATVRRNWMSVIPESVRLGRRGKVTLQFSIDRSGGVPKLVIAMPSGAEALDRAAVAAISASVPLPPLPKEFAGNQIRLQLNFQYNMQ